MTCGYTIAHDFEQLGIMDKAQVEAATVVKHGCTDTAARAICYGPAKLTASVPHYCAVAFATVFA